VQLKKEIKLDKKKKEDKIKLVGDNHMSFLSLETKPYDTICTDGSQSSINMGSARSPGTPRSRRTGNLPKFSNSKEKIA
jgi:hypothetical protein